MWKEISLLYKTILKTKMEIREAKSQNKKKHEKEPPIEDDVKLEDFPKTMEIIQFWNIF